MSFGCSSPFFVHFVGIVSRQRLTRAAYFLAFPAWLQVFYLRPFRLHSMQTSAPRAAYLLGIPCMVFRRPSYFVHCAWIPSTQRLLRAASRFSGFSSLASRSCKKKAFSLKFSLSSLYFVKISLNICKSQYFFVSL